MGFPSATILCLVRMFHIQYPCAHYGIIKELGVIKGRPGLRTPSIIIFPNPRMPVESIIVTGAALYGTASIVHKRFSPASQVEHIKKGVEEADGMYKEVISKTAHEAR